MIKCQFTSISQSFLIAIAVLFIFSCSPKKADIDSFKVESKGALREIMHQADISSKADLKDFEGEDSFYALGAVENLKGEILILDGKPFISEVKANNLQIVNSFDYNATLMVYTQNDKWNAVEIPQSIENKSILEELIENQAKELELNINEPFPFLIYATIDSLSWHVINWKDGDKVHTHEKHIKSGLHGSVYNQDVEILGFYSAKHHGIYTHHTSNMHMHFKTKDDKLSGHLDEISLKGPFTIKLPS